MTRYVVANWKSYKTMAEAESWLYTFSRLYYPDPQVKVILAPSFVFLAPLWQLLQEQGSAPLLALAVQDMSPFPLGAYTGAVAAAMVRHLVEYALVGHAERRRYFHETNQEVANKVSEAAAAGIRPIVCLDRPYARAQLTALNETETAELLIGYGPVEAIGIAAPQQPEKVARAIREIGDIMPDRPILYGGSITATNADIYIKLAGVAGLMVGTASLDAEEFAGICRIVSRSATD
jgi:triosephosphate isomerase